MGYQYDPERIEETTIRSFLSYQRGQQILEIGCGSGRLTPLFAQNAASVTAIDPDGEMIAQAEQGLAPHLHGRVRFHAVGIEDYAAPLPFDWVVLSWSL